MFECKVMNEKSIQGLVNDLRMKVVNENGKEVYHNFHYLSHYTIGFRSFSSSDRPDIDYVVAFLNKKIVGVLCFYPNANYGENIYSISYIDVRKDQRNKGIATEIYKKLNEHVNQSMIVYGTQPSVMGELCKLQEIRKRYLTNCQNFDDEDDMRVNHFGEKSFWTSSKSRKEKVTC
jgi:hypothetical protein